LPEDSEINRLREEIVELRMTVQTLKDTVRELTNKIHHEQVSGENEAENTMYSVSESVRNCVQYDVSWSRLVGIIADANSGLTAAELARKWGKSRSRTSEVLNRLVGEGHIVKYRDGREIKFRSSED
jgi:sugar-specific transcriptional regulator TrmB